MTSPIIPFQGDEPPPHDGRDQPREAPHNYEAEQGLLGAILTNNEAYHRVSEFLKPAMFADQVHGRIFEACGRLIERGSQANVVTLKRAFDADATLEEAGGGGYLVRLAASVVTIVNAADYAHEIGDLWLRRALIAEGRELIDVAG